MKNPLTILFAFALMLCATAACSSSTDKGEAAAADPNGLPVYNIPFSDTSTIDKADKKVLVLSASPRRGGNTDLLCDEFVKGAIEAGGDVEKIFLDDYRIDFFTKSTLSPPTQC